MLVLSRSDLERLLPPLEVIEAIAAAFRARAQGLTVVPPRSVSRVTDDGLLLLMPAVSRPAGGDGGGLGAKAVTVYADNRRLGLPTLHATYLLLDVSTGQPLALLEGTFLTGLRTGATSAVAARLLAKPGARRLTCFGAGAQAAFQLRCLGAVLPLERVDLVGRDPTRARAFARSMSRELGIEVIVADDPASVVRVADIVTCATTSSTPVLAGAGLRPGAHVDAVGAFRADTREVDTDTVRRARVVVDTYEGAFEEAGDILIPLAEGAIDRSHVRAELAELVTGARTGRERDDDVTLFKSVGFALEDLAAARLAYDRALAQGVGTRVAL